MQKPSRHMPSLKEARVANQSELGPVEAVIAYTFLAGIVAVFLYFLWNEPVGTVVCIVTFVLFVGAMSLLLPDDSDPHFERLSKGRENDSICTFARSFHRRRVDTRVIRAVYEQLQWYLEFDLEREKFPIRANDHLFDDLRIDEEDFELEVVQDIAYRTGRSLDNSRSNLFYGHVNTVSDLVAFFNSQPTADPLTA